MISSPQTAVIPLIVRRGASGLGSDTVLPLSLAEAQ